MRYLKSFLVGAGIALGLLCIIAIALGIFLLSLIVGACFHEMHIIQKSNWVFAAQILWVPTLFGILNVYETKKGQGLRVQKH